MAWSHIQALRCLSLQKIVVHLALVTRCFQQFITLPRANYPHHVACDKIYDWPLTSPRMQPLWQICFASFEIFSIFEHRRACSEKLTTLALVGSRKLKLFLFNLAEGRITIFLDLNCPLLCAHITASSAAKLLHFELAYHHLSKQFCDRLSICHVEPGASTWAKECKFCC